MTDRSTHTAANTAKTVENPQNIGQVSAAETILEATPLLGEPAANAVNNDPMRDWDGYAWYRKPSIFWLLPPYWLYSTAGGVVAVPRLNIILDLICREYFSERNSPGAQFIPLEIGGGDDEQCQIPEVHARTSTFILALGLLAGGIAALTAPRLGSISDRNGRRGLMAISSLGFLIAEITTILAAKYPDYFDVRILLLGSVVDGICGSFMLGMALANSYGADCTSPKHRATAFGALQGCLFLGSATGPIFGGLLVEKTGNILSPFYAALVAHTIYILYTLFILPESLSERRMRHARSKHAAERRLRGDDSAASNKHWANPKNLLEPLTILCPTAPGTTTRLRINMMLLAAIDFTLFGVGMGGMTVIIMYAERQFHWRNLESSIYLSVINSTRVTILLVVLPILVTYVRRNRTKAEHHKGSDKLDVALIRFAIVVEALGYFCYSIAPNGTIFTLAGVSTAFGGVGSPTIQSSLTKHIPSDKTGQLLGAMALLHSIARVVSPTIFNLVYAATVGSVPQTVFICLASAFSGAFVCSWFIKTGLHWDEQKDDGHDA
ncbi:major facilitator superfamily domain-containing protein [Sphaerosporella brunnea]|uniref:Major facilitator superfamily domain-containing protein n=1 Tax=Sphaerosporella brunnea TaxID=1250544 RepID=A0A5J5F166_9PEZI|nr:major facilitator superfamily domain-containing protein [Sphaerosporella brunnea]